METEENKPLMSKYPEETEIITFRTGKHIVNSIDSLAVINGATRSYITRALVREGLKHVIEIRLTDK